MSLISSSTDTSIRCTLNVTEFDSMDFKVVSFFVRYSILIGGIVIVAESKRERTVRYFTTFCCPDSSIFGPSIETTSMFLSVSLKKGFIIKTSLLILITSEYFI